MIKYYPDYKCMIYRFCKHGVKWHTFFHTDTATIEWIEQSLQV